MAALVFLGVCLICATFNWQISVTGAVVSITNTFEKVADFFVTTIEYVNPPDGSIDDWQPPEEVEGDDGTVVSGQYLKQLLQEVNYGARSVYYCGRWSWFEANTSLYRIDTEKHSYYFCIKRNPPFYVDEEGNVVNSEDYLSIFRTSYVFAIYYVGNSHVDDWRNAGTFLYAYGTDSKHFFRTDMIIDISSNGYSY